MASIKHASHSDTAVLASIMRLWASGTPSDDSRSVTWSSVTARCCCCCWQSVAPTFCYRLYACVGLEGERGTSRWSADQCCIVAPICDLYMLWCVSFSRHCVFRCPRWVWKPVGSAVASVTLTVSLHPTRSCCHMLPGFLSLLSRGRNSGETRGAVCLCRSWLPLPLSPAYCPWSRVSPVDRSTLGSHLLGRKWGFLSPNGCLRMMAYGDRWCNHRA